MASKSKFGVTCAALAVICSALSLGCGARTDQGAVTETGNPSFIKETRITATPLDGVVIVRGAAGAVPNGSRVSVVNEEADATEETAASDDGSFELTVEGQAGDTVAITVERDGQSETKQLQVEAVTDPTTTPTNSTADATQTPPRVPLEHRPEREDCDEERPPGSFEEGGVDSFDPTVCSRDADCVDGVRGRCMAGRAVMCTYDQCTQDNECTAGGPCQCAHANHCLQGNCQVDADCGEVGYCSPSMGTCGSYLGIIGYWCHTPTDECVDDADCTDPSMGPGYCMYSPEATKWLCAYSSCVG